MKSSVSKLIGFTFFFCCVFFVSCSDSNKSEVIEKDVLINILTDLHITDALLANKGMYDGRIKDTTKSYYNYLLKKYNISRADFDYSLDYYSNNAEEYILIYDEVIAKIDERMPRKLHQNSIYKFFEDAIREAEILSDLEGYYGKNGRELWVGRRNGTLPKDSAGLKLVIEKEVNYPCLIVLDSEIKLNSKDTSKNLRMELELIYKDSSRVTDTAFFTSENKKKWEWKRIILKTDSLKDPQMVKAKLLAQENDSNISKLEIRRISLKQYAPDKDTSSLPEIVNQVPVRMPVKKNRTKTIKNPKKGN